MNAPGNPLPTDETPDRDLLAEWLTMGQKVLERYFPKTTYAALVAEQPQGVPAVQLVVIPNSSSASTAL